MKVFCDTNIIVEVLQRREYESVVKRILGNIDNEFYLSTGSFYTLAYLADKFIRRRGIPNPQRTLLVKQQLLDILQIFNVEDVDKTAIAHILEGESFTDIEDGFQYQAALACGAEVLLTINDKDFQDADQTIVKVMTPTQFAEQYL